MKSLHPSTGWIQAWYCTDRTWKQQRLGQVGKELSCAQDWSIIHVLVPPACKRREGIRRKIGYFSSKRECDHWGKRFIFQQPPASGSWGGGGRERVGKDTGNENIKLKFNENNALTSWVSPDEQLSDFVVHPDQDGKRYSHEPVLEPGSGNTESHSETSKNNSAAVLGSLSVLSDATKTNLLPWASFLFLN